MKLSIIVPAFNEQRLLAGTLERLRAGIGVCEARGWRCELIVCDNNSTDGTAEIARTAGARVVFEPENHIGLARNRGARAACGDWLLFVDADSSPAPALFDELLSTISTGRCVGGGATLALPGAPRAVRAWAVAWNLLSRGVRWAAGSFLFCEAAAFRAVGGFSESLYAAEEIDLSHRLKRRYPDRNFVILHRHPLVTSARKAELYTWRDHASFLAGVVLSGGRSLQRREGCGLWYDGRR